MRALALAAAAMLAACQSAPDGELNVAGECAVTPALEALAGERVTDSLLREARRFSRAKVVRRIAPNTAVTMDYRVDRLNLHVDGRNVVQRVSCG